VNIAIPERQPRKQLSTAIVVAGGCALTVAAAIFGVTQTGSDGRSQAARSVVTTAPRTDFGPAVQDQSLTYYLVASEEQARMVRLGEEDAAAIRQEADLTGGKSYVEVVETPEDLSRAIEAIMSANGARLEAGLPEITVVDLRP
jgi:hypothetical protein